MSPADERTADGEERLMNGGRAIITNPQSAELMQPTQRALDHPARHAQSAAVHPLTFADDRLDVANPQAHSIGLRSIAGVALHGIRPEARRPRNAAHGWNRIHQRQHLRDIRNIGRSHDRGQRNAVGINDDVMFRAWFGTIGWIGTGQFAPPTARTEALSTTARDQSILSAARSWFSSNRWMASHTPAACQSRNLRQQVMPQQPNSRGRYSHGMPVNSTKRMPLSTDRLSRRFRPGLRNRRGGTGINGSIAVHSSSSRIGLVMVVPPCTTTISAKPMPLC